MLQILVGSATFLGGLALILALHDATLLALFIPLMILGAVTMLFVDITKAHEIVDALSCMLKTFAVFFGGIAILLLVAYDLSTVATFATAVTYCTAALFTGCALMLISDHYAIDVVFAVEYPRWGEAYTRERSVMMS